MQMAAEFFLGLAIGAAWLGAAGFARLRTPLDRVHAVTFVNAVAGMAIAAAAFAADGPSDRAFKILAIAIVNLVSGAALSHMTGRAICARGEDS